MANILSNKNTLFLLMFISLCLLQTSGLLANTSLCNTSCQKCKTKPSIDLAALEAAIGCFPRVHFLKMHWMLPSNETSKVHQCVEPSSCTIQRTRNSRFIWTCSKPSKT